MFTHPCLPDIFTAARPFRNDTCLPRSLRVKGNVFTMFHTFLSLYRASEPLPRSLPVTSSPVPCSGSAAAILTSCTPSDRRAHSCLRSFAIAVPSAWNALPSWSPGQHHLHLQISLFKCSQLSDPFLDLTKLNPLTKHTVLFLGFFYSTYYPLIYYIFYIHFFLLSFSTPSRNVNPALYDGRNFWKFYSLLIPSAKNSAALVQKHSRHSLNICGLVQT